MLKNILTKIWIKFSYKRLKLLCDKMECQFQLAKKNDLLLSLRLESELTHNQRFIVEDMYKKNKSVMFRLCKEIVKTEMLMEKLKQNNNN